MSGPLWETTLLNADFRDMLSTLSAENAECMVIEAQLERFSKND